MTPDRTDYEYPGTWTYYASPGALTALDADQVSLADRVPTTPVEICRLVQGLVIDPEEAASLPLPPERSATKDHRRTSDIIRSLTALDPAPLDVARPPRLRVVGTCRHFAVVSCALLRLRGVPARARCGFATYFLPGRSVDHWLTEYWHTGQQRWVRVDSQILGTDLVADPADVAVGEFWTGGEAWTEYRAGSVDPDTFGVAGTSHAWGVAEIRGNAIRDLASLRKVEMLPWDEWGRMEASYQGRTGPDYDALIDRVAAACGGDDPDALAATYASEDLPVPTERYGTG